MAMTPANKHEIKPLTRLLDGSEDMLFTGSAYCSQKLREWIEESYIKDRVQRKGYRNNELAAGDRVRNVETSVTGGRIEAIFGHMKLLRGMDGFMG